MKQVLGVVGLGRMGGAIAARLAAAGHDVAGYDTSPRALAPPGVAPAANVTALAANVDIALLSLPDGAASRAVCHHLAHAENRRVATVVDLSTVGTEAARTCAAMLAAAGLTYVDAPISGGVAGATSGLLTMMIATEAPTVEALTPILETVAARRFHVGRHAGDGQAVKLLNNYVSAAALAATSEAVVFAERAGLDPAVVVDVLNHASGRTTASSDKFPTAVLTGTYDYGFAGALMAKDVGLYLDAAAAAGAPIRLAGTTAALWADFTAACPGADFTYMHGYLADTHKAPQDA